jgi:serine/threonine protein kinase
MEPVDDQRVYSSRYQVTHLIARGGMAMVYRAHDLLLNRFVALKILYPELSVDRNFVERFRREAQAAANLSHPNIVPIFDWGEENGTYFIVMELIEGTSLAELLADSRTLSPAKSAQVCAQVASALAYAHRQGVVHRDVKPGNILLTSDGQVKVTDFGIAQAVSTEDNLTVAGSVMGTATYFSPEQAEGSMVDGRSDVYSLGVVLYELLAGRPPFVGDSPVAVASKHVREIAPSPRQFNQALPVDLEAITMHALAKQPADRYQTADDMRADLLRFSEGQPVSVNGRSALMGDDVTRAVAVVAPVGDRTQAVPVMSGPRTDIKRRKRKWPWIMVIVLVLLLAGAAAAYFVTKKTPVTSMPSLINQPIGTATSTLYNDGFTHVNSVAVSSSKDTPLVVKTDPAAGKKISKGQVITIFYSKGQQTSTVTVPDVRYESLTAADVELQSYLLNATPTFVTIGTGGYAPGTVINQTPAPGQSAQSGSFVTLTVVAPNATFPLPKVVGQTVTQAASILGSHQLNVSSTTSTTCSNTVTKGSVAATNPSEGSQVATGQSIELITSSGYCDVIVPNVIGDTQAAATSALEAPTLNLKPTYNYLAISSPACIVDGTPKFDYVTGTNPPSGGSLLYGSAITVNYCPPAEVTTAPTTTPTTSPPVT